MLTDFFAGLMGANPSPFSPEEEYRRYAQMSGLGQQSIADQLHAQMNPIIIPTQNELIKEFREYSTWNKAFKKKKEDVMEITADHIGQIKKIDGHFLIKIGCNFHIADTIKEATKKIGAELEKAYKDKK